MTSQQPKSGGYWRNLRYFGILRSIEW